MASAFPTGAGSIAHALVVWAFFFALYLLFAGQTSEAELIVGAIVSGLAALYQLVLRWKSELSPRLPVTALYPMVPALGALPRDIFRVGGALFAALFGRPTSGRVRVVAPPSGADPASIETRGAAIAAASLAPNSFVLAGAIEDGRMVVHRLSDDGSEQAI